MLQTLLVLVTTLSIFIFYMPHPKVSYLQSIFSMEFDWPGDEATFD